MAAFDDVFLATMDQIDQLSKEKGTLHWNRQSGRDMEC
jgi:hypothetical protein